MWLIHAAMRRPITILMVIAGVALCSILAIRRMKTDIFPELGTPVIYVAQPYGGMDAAQMEGYLVNYYEYHFLYISGIDYVESRSIQGASIMKLHFHEGTDMAQAMAETVAQVNRSRAFMPPGTVPPFVTRFDTGSVPVGYLVFSSETRGVDEISDLALFRVRPMFTRLPGVSAPPPFGGTARTLVVRADPDRLRAYQMSPDEVVQAIAKTNTLSPSGNVRIGDLNRIAPLNATVAEATELNSVPIRQGSGPTVYLRDIGYAEDAADILTSYALVNGRRAVYIAATKRADASTLEVVRRVRESLPSFQAAIPEDINVSFELDQSFYVTNALRALLQEGLMSAFLTGLMILVMLRSLRTALVVVTTIPVALLSAVVALWAAEQSLNLMTLGGLTLAIGILVDESVVAVENIHTHLSQSNGVARAVLEASREVLAPRLLAMLSVVSVFAPSFFMEGVARAMFVPMGLAVGFSMIASYFLASSLVPIMETWLNRKRGAHPSQEEGASWFERFRESFGALSRRLIRQRWTICGVYLAVAAAVVVLAGSNLGTDIFPQVDTGLVQMRLRAPTGTRVERTERIAQDVLAEIRRQVGEKNVQSSLAFVGVQPSTYPVNLIFLWTSGSHEAVMQIAVRPEAGIPTTELQERLRQRIADIAPGTSLTFEAADLVSQVMSFGAPTPVEIAVTSPNLATNRQYAESIVAQLKQLGSLRDVQLGELLEYPTVNIRVDRERSAQLGVTVSEVGRALSPATWSSRFTTPVYWADPRSGIAYQVQVEVPQSQISSIDDLRRIPVKNGDLAPTLLGDVADLSYGMMFGEYHRYNMQRMVTVNANTMGTDLDRVAAQVSSVLKRLPEPPRGVTVAVRGQIAPMKLMVQNLLLGLSLSVIAVFILLAAYFQSIRVAFVVLLAIPSVLAGVALALFLTRTTLNIQSFMGAMMAVGISVANTILLCTFADQSRRKGVPAGEAAVDAAITRVRPVLMTSIVMITSMLPLALGTAQTAPLGVAVIGGLIAATVTTLLIIPSAFTVAEGHGGTASPSIDPDDPASPHYDGAATTLGQA
ncbi:MAG: efflux RND transporter permease subunit [Acidobacteria bacterium]|nr:efflux RND transporter permease subunit [Acidobacteriota bacterium]